MGPIGSGKTTFAKTLVNDTTICISQDEMGREAYLEYFKQALKDKTPRVIIDRQNFNREQRDRFIQPAREAGYCVTVFEFKTNRAVCHERVARTGHPTVPAGDNDLTAEILTRYQINYEALSTEEFDNYNEVYNEG